MRYADIAWKEGFKYFLEPGMALLFPEAHAQIDWSRGYELLDKELQQIHRDGELGPRLVDTLAKVFLKNGDEHWILMHVDVQGQPQAEFGRRMYVYNYRIFDRYNRLVASFAILADDQPNWRPDGFGYNLLGCKIDFRFPTVKLLDFVGKEAELEASDNLFAVVILAFLKARETADDESQRRFWKLRLIRGLYERKRKREDIQNLFRMIHWFMVLPKSVEDEIWQEVQIIEREKQMPYMTPLEESWLEDGMRKGEAKGRAEGEAKVRPMLEEAIEVALQGKFGATAAAALVAEMRSAPLAHLHAALKAIHGAISPDDVRRAMSKSEPTTD